MNPDHLFEGKAAVYAHSRPGYPEALLTELLQRGWNNHTLLADVGAGTGIFSLQLADKGLRVLAIEPNEDMRAVAESALHPYAGCKALPGTAEETGLETGSIDVITVAQAFHWFDKEKFRAECRRILRPEGEVVLIWNSRDAASEVIAVNEQICKKFCSEFKGFSGGFEQSPENLRPFFRNGQYKTIAVRQDLVYDKPGFIGRNLSASYAPKEDDAAYQPFIAALEDMFEQYGVEEKETKKITIPNECRAYIGLV